jgi:type VI secretion system secreted protein Hcp
MAGDIFIKIGDIKGESRDAKHKDEIDVLAWSWGMSQSGSMHSGGGGGAGKVNVQDLSFTKGVDKATPNLMKYCCNGKQMKDATLVVRKAGTKPLEYIVIKMEDVIITSVSGGGSGGEDVLTENITLNFAKVQYEYQPQKDDGSKDGGAIPMNWNIKANAEK